MPSPILITVPTSITVTPVSKFSICLRIISLISLARIGSMISSMVRRVLRRVDSFPRKFQRKPLQLATHGSIKNSRADMSHHSTDKPFVGCEAKPYDLASCGSKRVLQGLPGFLRYVSRRYHSGGHQTASIVEHVAQSLSDLSQLRKSLILQEHLKKAGCRLSHFGARD